ncbi:MAG: preprotein translocase subunit SecY, partial [Gammaproteobacteria bacterium]|nr:preprotein translocase subunit SecY [Gammaproteobacteria bacterium]
MEELRKRLFFVFGAILVYRVGTYIPVPGINPAALASFFEQQSGTIIDMFNMFSGGALERFSILALGIMPYISASIIMQLMSATMPALKEIKKQGEAGRKKITQYTRYGTLGLATLQAGGVAVALQSQGIALYSGSGFVFSTIVTLVTGTMFLMW